MLTRAKLDEMTAHGCSLPDCRHDDHGVLFLHGRCHMQGRIEVSYRNGSGVLRVGCKECGKLIANIRVADAEAE